MNKLTFLRIPLAILILLLPLQAVAFPVYANTLIRNDGVITYDYDRIVGAPVNPSGCDFDIHVHGEGMFRDHLWFDRQDRPIDELFIFGNLKEVWSANGKTLDVGAQGPVRYHADYYPDKFTITVRTYGATLLITIPGYGIVFGGGANIVETYTFTLDDQLVSYSQDKSVGNLNLDDWGPVCAYFGS